MPGSMAGGTQVGTTVWWPRLEGKSMLHRDTALEDMTKLKELIDANTFAPALEQMQQRAWLMHWGLYIFFNHENGRNLIIDFLFQDR